MADGAAAGGADGASADGSSADGAAARGAAAARDQFRERIGAAGHAVENVRQAVEGLEAAIARGDIRLTAPIRQMLEDLGSAIHRDDGQKLGGKSAEAARFIARAVLRQLDAQVPPT